MAAAYNFTILSISHELTVAVCIAGYTNLCIDLLVIRIIIIIMKRERERDFDGGMRGGGDSKRSRNLDAHKDELRVLIPSKVFLGLLN